MTEREMEDLLWLYPEALLGEPFKPLSRQPSSQVGRADLVFEHPRGYRLIVEIKRGVAPRGVGDQLHDYWGADKDAHPDEPIEMMVVANEIPRERRRYLDKRDIDAMEISEKKFRDVARRGGYTFASEQKPLEVQSNPARGLSANPVLRAPAIEPAAAVPSGGSPRALFATLEPSNLQAVFGRRDEISAIGTNCVLHSARDLEIRHVYFRAKGENEVSARAELLGIYTDMPDASRRLPGYEHECNAYYYDIRNPEDFQIPVQSLRYWGSKKNLRNDAQGVRVICAP